MFENSAWSSMAQILQYITLLFLDSFTGNVDWIDILIMISASCHIIGFTIVEIVFELFFNYRQNITNSSGVKNKKTREKNRALTNFVLL